MAVFLRTLINIFSNLIQLETFLLLTLQLRSVRGFFTQLNIKKDFNLSGAITGYIASARLIKLPFRVKSQFTLTSSLYCVYHRRFNVVFISLYELQNIQ